MRKARLLLIALGIPTLLAYGTLVLAQWRSGAALAQFRSLQKAHPPDSQMAAPPAVLDRKLEALAQACRMAPADSEPAYQLALLQLVSAEVHSLAPQTATLPLESGPDPGLTHILQEGLRAIHRAIALNPGAAEYHFVAALILQNLAGTQSDEPRALDPSPVVFAHLENSERLDPFKPSLHFRIGSFQRALGNREEAKRAFSVALEQNPEKAKDVFGVLWSFTSSPAEIRSFVDHKPRVCVLLAEFLAEHGFKDEARAEYEEAAANGEDDFEISQALIRKYLREKENDRVLALVRRIESTSENREASRRASLLYAAGQAHFNKEEFESAVANYETALRFDESRLFIHHSLALAFLKQKRYSKAVARWQYLMSSEAGRSQLGKAIENVHLGLAQAYEGQGKYPEALAEYLEAARINPANRYATAKISEISHRL